jgi:hypothetical protein
MRLKDSNEELIVVEGLTPQHTIALFRRAAQRVITIKEEEELLGRKDCQHRIKVHDHDLFKKIGGNPQSILLIAPMLNDPKGKISLSELYRILNSEKINNVLDREDMKIQEGMTASMRISMEASFKRVEQDDEEALDLFFIVSMFPGGI